MVTAEFAVALLGVVILAVVAGWAIFLGAVQVRCIDAANEIARQAARGDRAALERARRDVPPGGVVEIRREGSVRLVAVRVPARPPVPAAPVVLLEAEARVEAEPGE